MRKQWPSSLPTIRWQNLTSSSYMIVQNTDSEFREFVSSRDIREMKNFSVAFRAEFLSSSKFKSERYLRRSCSARFLPDQIVRPVYWTSYYNTFSNTPLHRTLLQRSLSIYILVITNLIIIKFRVFNKHCLPRMFKSFWIKRNPK